MSKRDFLKVHSYNRVGRTELQWQKEGRVVKDGETGQEMWINGYKQDTAIYYTEDQTRPMNKRELAKIKKEESAKRRAKAAARKKKKAEQAEAERIRQLVEKELDRRRETRINSYYNKELGRYVKRFKEIQDFSSALVIEVKSNGDYVGFDDPDIELTSLTMLSLDGKTVISIPDYTEATLEDLNRVNQALEGACCYIAYNCSFHLRMLKKYDFLVRENCKTFCLMDMYSIVHSSYSEYWEHFTWCRQSSCANHCRIDYSRADSDVDANMVRFSFPLIMGEMLQAYEDPDASYW